MIEMGEVLFGKEIEHCDSVFNSKRQIWHYLEKQKISGAKWWSRIGLWWVLLSSPPLIIRRSRIDYANQAYFKELIASSTSSANFKQCVISLCGIKYKEVRAYHLLQNMRGKCLVSKRVSHLENATPPNVWKPSWRELHETFAGKLFYSWQGRLGG